MADKVGQTETLQPILNRLNAGDESALDALFEHAMERMRWMARKRLHNNPSIQRKEQTDDILQGVALRMLRALKDVKPPTVRDLLNLTATQIRREMIDLYRHHYGKEGDAAHQAPDPGKPDSQGNVRPRVEAEPDSEPGPSSQARANELDERVQSLPDEEREVFNLLFYLSMSQLEVAQQLGVSVPTVKRRWRKARLLLHDVLKDATEE